VLPKFKVAVEFAQKNGKPQRDYRPGDQSAHDLRLATKYAMGKENPWSMPTRVGMPAPSSLRSHSAA
jgi:hypothetical protein